ncbi:MAG: hypothetical protein A2Y16_05365 [Tenericutes bacterium GWF2_57_13]|nr:MAG: hypothetical protein A2Y16_05365 [Tenericutes bacterium GWF2_57_13]
MRKFLLWNSAKTSSHDFDVYKSIISEVSGLGTDFEVTTTNKRVTGFERKYDDVILMINFGVGGNAYGAFKDLTDFIALNGTQKFILEYRMGTRILYCDVWIKGLTKSQITAGGVLVERLTLHRSTSWYTIQDGSIPTYPSGIGIENSTFESAPINFTITSPTTGQTELQLKQGTTIIGRISITINANETISILSDEKKITITLGGVVSNGYNRIYRLWDSFMFAPQGTYTLVATIVPATGTVQYSVKKWVLG